ncbi:hypothetical protein G5I_12067 [Acromyrmex echinatior]|uniref:Uncharacterized protein n=1 Tax=Acromyrmex echinatior TaxID=103372 RepID=F4X1A8_ACREC|nr:hypothetical protein G5I_12067 [Acromyrmex echinatior]
MVSATEKLKKRRGGTETTYDDEGALWTEQTTRRRERDFLTVWCDFNSAVRESNQRADHQLRQLRVGVEMLTDMTPAAAGQLYPQLQSIAKSPVHGHVNMMPKRLAATVKSFTPPIRSQRFPQRCTLTTTLVADTAVIISGVIFDLRRQFAGRLCVLLSDVPLTFSRATMDCERPLQSAMFVVQKTASSVTPDEGLWREVREAFYVT